MMDGYIELDEGGTSIMMLGKNFCMQSPTFARFALGGYHVRFKNSSRFSESRQLPIQDMYIPPIQEGKPGHVSFTLSFSTIQPGFQP